MKPSSCYWIPVAWRRRPCRDGPIYPGRSEHLPSGAPGGLLLAIARTARTVREQPSPCEEVHRLGILRHTPAPAPVALLPPLDLSAALDGELSRYAAGRGMTRAEAAAHLIGLALVREALAVSATVPVTLEEAEAAVASASAVAWAVAARDAMVAERFGGEPAKRIGWRALASVLAAYRGLLSPSPTTAEAAAMAALDDVGELSASQAEALAGWLQRRASFEAETLGDMEEQARKAAG
jgi:hypothetical protein